MNPIQYAVGEIKRNIPPAIINKFFMPTKYNQLRRDPFMPMSPDEQIIEKVINARVRLDCDIAGATEAVIPLRGLTVEIINRDRYVIHIPKERTNGRTITSALSLVFYSLDQLGLNAMSMTGMGQVANPNSGCSNGVVDAAVGMAKSFQPTVASETSRIRIKDGHTLIVDELIMPTPNSYLRCILSMDATFSTLARPSWKHFGKLCVLATKAHIYNEYIVELDMAEIVAGQELGKFKEIIESYSEANDLYDEFYNDKWRKVQFMSDEYRHTRYLNALVGKGK